MLFPMVNACVMNQFKGHWLLSNALFETITMTCKLRKKVEMNLLVNGLMEENVIIGVELDLLAFNIKRQVFGVLDVLLSFLKKFDGKKTHNMFALMLDLRYKNFRVVSIFVGKELVVGVVEDYDKKAHFPSLLKIYQFLHPLVNFGSMGERASDEDFNLTFLRCLLGQLNFQKRW
jgi:hypothetical protein